MIKFLYSLNLGILLGRLHDGERGIYKSGGERSAYAGSARDDGGKRYI